MTKTVDLTDDAFEALREVMVEGETVSDAVKRLARRKDARALLKLGPRDARSSFEALRERSRLIDLGKLARRESD